MPYRPRSSCTQPGCPNLVTTPGRCAQHRQAFDASRGTAAQRGYDAEWRRLRLAFLHDNPWCAECGRQRIYTLATEVDHIVPKRRGGSDEGGNLQGLCKSHHASKTMREMNEMGRG